MISQKTVSEEEFLRTQVTAIEKIKYLSHVHPLFKEWDRQNQRFLKEQFTHPYLERYRLILFSNPQRNGFIFRKPSVSWEDKEHYQRGLQRAKVFFKSVLWELTEVKLEQKRNKST